MFKKSIGLLILALFAVPLAAGKPGVPPVDKKAGYALLEIVGQAFHDMAVSGPGGAEQVTQSLHKFMADARKARAQNQIDGVFFARYARILAVAKIAAGPDPEGIFVPMFNEELSRFVREVLGQEYKDSGPEAIGQVAGAIADELINLRLYLDNIETKEILRKAWDEKMSAPGNKKR